MLQSATDHKTYQQRNLTILPGSFAPTENGPVIAVANLGARRPPKPQLTDGLPSFKKDRIQLQQVILNLIMNAVEAMSGTSEGPRELLISARKEGPSGMLVVLQDSGPGRNPDSFDRLFDAFI